MKAAGSEEMLRRAALARQHLTAESVGRIRDYIGSQHASNGGFLGRSGHSDIYYTVFGLSSLLALRMRPPSDRGRQYLDAFGDGDGLDLVHLNCLVRCRQILPFLRLPPLGRTLVASRLLPLRRFLAHLTRPSTAQDNALLARIENCRAADGGYSQQAPGAVHGSVYASFLALQSYEDCQAVMPKPEGMLGSIASLRTPDGGYANAPGLAAGTTTATAAAMLILADLGQPPGPATVDWLLSQANAKGGFHATPGALVPDLLSTATALHALRTLGVPLDGQRDACLAFVDSLWTDAGGFSGTVLDPTPDCEYTFYALLALGCLAED